MGIHLEVPFLSPEYKGAMPEHLLKKNDAPLVKHYQELAQGDIRYMTISPELEGVQDMLPVMKELGIVAGIGHSGATYEQAMSAIARMTDPPTCVLMPDDHTCLGALEAAADLGLRVPEDISIGGYDGISLSQLIRPRLTTIQQDTQSIGTQAARLLIDRIENPRTAISETASIPVKLLPGESIGPVKKG